ncbi:MAG: DNA mismatch repair endonuclease MutL [Lachnospiraceae bacterium]|nr:DNA mismatch repair endonuclease MutL [Lachnospiraceae bacterium]
MVNDVINLLSEGTIDKIAAGEVIERPSSVVKELVENAIDAGSKAVSVEIKDGGISYIRITDDGSGIRADQIKKAFLRHSTSKINDADDLYTVRTLGFRGEALSSIAAVSKVNLLTKTEDNPIGVSYIIEGGKEKSFSEIGAPKGTTFIISDLFYNTPVRKKFLNSPQTEGMKIQELMEHLALSNPGISFRFINQGKEKMVTPGNGSLKDTIYRIYGREITNNMLPIDFETNNMKVSGFIGKAVINRGNRKYESFFVDGRYVHGKMLSRSVEEGYKGYLMQHQYPFFILNLSFPPGKVDVNFHPKKEEVRIENKDEIYTELTVGVHERLIRREDIDVIPLDNKIKEVNSSIKNDFTDDEEINLIPQKPKTIGFEPFEKKVNTETLEKEKEDVPKLVKEEELKEEAYKDVSEQISLKEDVIDFTPIIPKDVELEIKHEKKPKVSYEQRSFLTPESKAHFNIIGQVFETYWIIEYDSKMYIVDQHAAHEKVNFERLMKKVATNEVYSQTVSPPIIVSLNSEEQDVLEKYMSDFEALGFSISSFGGNDFALTEVPYEMESIDKKRLFYDILSDAGKWKNVSDAKLVRERIATMACKASIKGNQKISRLEMEELISEMLTLENPYHCPHGRPTMVAFSRDDLDKMFKRIV